MLQRLATSKKFFHTSTAHAARQYGLTLTISGPGGTIASIGAVSTSPLQRVITGSDHVRLGSPMALAPLLRQKVSPSTIPLPPSSPFPPFPTLSRRPPRRISTTNYAPGAGRPRLIFVVGSEYWDGTAARVFDLLPTTTSIGSAEHADLRLEGLETLDAVIHHTQNDEYVLTVNGDASTAVTLRTGVRIDLGPWRMAYFREEFADHGRPYGGRLGGELSRQRPQQERGHSATTGR